MLSDLANMTHIFKMMDNDLEKVTVLDPLRDIKVDR